MLKKNLSSSSRCKHIGELVFFNGKNSFLLNAQVNGFVSDVHVNGNVAKV